ncbi:hypothetical protein TCE0_034r12242 [Talaromyces pinophilus]|uniref:Beta-lactamase-related domain-containing protein n=1 Tax=Talaromyces pinophilus TaxID=128442 RepID=A0A6V8HFY2_TALPI|nr:hypothetical protein TCE0_034r12242 [Talaromyces pinophilus]
MSPYVKIDTHSHFLPPDYRNTLENNGHAHPDGMPGIPEWSVETHLEMMKSVNVTKSYLSISSPGTHLIAGDNKLTRKLTRYVNDYASELKKKYPDHFGFFATLALGDVMGSLEEIPHAFDNLNADGLTVMTNFHGSYLGHKDFDPIFDELNRRHAIVFIHPTTPCLLSGPSATPLSAIPRPMFEFLFDTARAIINLFLSGIVSRCSNITWIVPHCGGAFPPLINRFSSIGPIVGSTEVDPRLNPKKFDETQQAKMAKIAANAIPRLKQQIDDLTSDPDGAPGIVFAAVNKNGDNIFSHASGKIGVGKSGPMTLESVFWLASCTKIITSIAALQLVEQGKLSLDDSDQVERLAPELKAVQVLENGKLVPKVRSITLRMLLTHTAGFGYAFFNERLNEWAGPVGIDEFSGSYHDFLSQPLVNQPGERWEYGINIDWAGQLVERASGQKLNAYFQERIFAPLNITHINMFPTDEMKANLAYLNIRAADGKLSLNLDGHLNRRALYAKTQAELDTTFHQGGSGLFAQPTQFTQIIVTLLNDGVHPKLGNRILKKETVDEMFTNQIPQFPYFARQGIYPSKPRLANPSSVLYPEPDDGPQGWGLTFYIHLRESFVHSKGTAWWGGLPNVFWWIDRRMVSE